VTPRTLAVLIFCNLVWSAHPVMGKLVLRDFTPVEGAWLRYLAAWLSFVAALGVLRALPAKRRIELPTWPAHARPRDWLFLFLVGALPFCLSPLLQMTGLAASRATDNALIVAMEPMFTVLLACVFLRERLYPFHVIAFAIALLGFALLAGLSWSRLSGGWDRHLVGNLILLLSLSGEAAYTVIGRQLTRDFKPMSIYTAAITVGTLLLTVLAASTTGLPDPSKFTWTSALGILWVGPLGTGLTYLLWVFVLVRVPAATIAITLFIQPVMGAVWGHLFLDERLSPVQSLGGLLILVAVLGQSWGERRASPGFSLS
jgi:drug/metabolite transporter (DMT)-like permease